jgi:hypothetical protein
MQTFYQKPHPEVVLQYPNPSTLKKYRAIAVSAADAGWRLIIASRELLKQPFELFEYFDKRYPESNIPLSFVLENGIMVTRALDQCTALYQLESNYIATKLRILFVILAAIAGCVEVVLIVGIYRVAIRNQYTTLNAAIQSLKELSPELVSSEVYQLTASILKDKKASKKAAKAANAMAALDGSEASGSDSEATSSDALSGSDGESEGEKSEKSGKSSKSGVTDELRKRSKRSSERKRGVAMNDKSEVTSQRMQQSIISVVYCACLLVIWLCLVILCFLCIRVINAAQSAAGEINNSGRRSFLAERVAYLSSELVHSGPSSITQDEALLGGDLTWLSTREIIRCQLDRSILGLLSVHYALLYGKAAGWIDMAQGFPRGPVREWGSGGSTDQCSPFTWDKEVFGIGVQLAGSLGRYESQDNLLFKSVCLTELPETAVPRTALTFQNPRLKPHSNPFLTGSTRCKLFRQHCRLLNADQHASLSAAEKRVRYSATTNFLNMPDTDGAFASVPQCGPRTAGAPGKDGAAGKAVDGNAGPKAIGNRVMPRPDPCPQTPYPAACYFRSMANDEEAQCQCTGGEVSPEGCVAEPRQARDFPCPDGTASSGLHNYLVTYIDTAIRLVSVQDSELDDKQSDYRFIADYYTPELIMGLSAATFLYLQEVMFAIEDSTIVTQVGFAIMLAVILLQYSFLKLRIYALAKKHDAVLRIVKRFHAGDEEMQRQRAKHRSPLAWNL